MVTMAVMVVSSSLCTSSQIPGSTISANRAAVSAETTTYAQAKMLEVPYISQGDTSWCFQTSLSMVLGYYGDNVSPENVAYSFGYGPKGSINLSDMFLGRVDSYIKAWPGLSVKHHIGSWSFSEYARNIDSGAPVIVSTFGLPGHTIIVVGYYSDGDEQYLYVHDPSGFLSEYTWGGLTAEYAAVSWAVFSRYGWTQLVIQSSN